MGRHVGAWANEQVGRCMGLWVCEQRVEEWVDAGVSVQVHGHVSSEWVTIMAVKET